MTDNVHVFNDAQLTPAQKAYFAERYAIECEIDDLKAEHIAPLNEDLKALKGKFKAESGIDLKVSNALYALYKLDRSASRLLEKEDEEKRRDDLERCAGALAKGMQLDWFSEEAFKASKRRAAEPDPMLEEEPGPQIDDEGETGHCDDEERAPAGPAELTFASAEREEGDPMLEDTAQAWEDGAAADQGNAEHLDQGGHIFAEGKEAGRAGMLSEDNPYEASEGGELWERGRAMGFKQFLDAEAKAVADDHEAEEGEGAEVVNLFGDDDGVEIPAGEALGAERPAFPAAI